MSNFFITPQKYIGIDKQSTTIRIASIFKSKKNWKIISLQELTLDTDLQPSIKEGVLTSILKGRDLLIRPCKIPVKKPKDVFAALNFHVEPHLPYPIEGAIVQAQILGLEKDQSALSVFSIEKERLQKHLEDLHALNIEPEVITSPALALAAFSTLFPVAHTPQLIVHESESEISVLLTQSGKVLAYRALDPQQNLESELQKTILRFSSHSFESIYFIGNDARLKETLAHTCEQEVRKPYCPSLSLSDEELTFYALAIGSAMASQEMNFRQQEFIYPHPFKRLKKPLATTFVLLTLLAGALFWTGEGIVSSKKQAVETTYLNFLKNEKLNLPSTPQTPLEYERSISELAKNIQARPNTYPLYPQIPQVKELLSFLTSIPETKKELTPVVEIESLHYQMVSRPDFAHKKQKYKVRVDLELAAKDGGAARDFYEALKNNTRLIDTREGVQWVAAKGNYKASFYLKDHTRYH